jgi:protein-tyrosine phosphatase
MDIANLRDLRGLARSPEARAKLSLLRSFDAGSPAEAAVPDPYYGGEDGFDEVLDLCHAACSGLLEHIRREHRL